MAIVGAVSIGLLPVVAFVALFVAAVVFDVPIELPPGDVYSLTIVNTTPRPVEAFICDDGTCTRGVAPETIPPGRHNRGSFNEDQYTPSPVGLADPVTHKLLGCLTPPGTHSYSQPLATTEVAMSSMHGCEKHRTRLTQRSPSTTRLPRALEQRPELLLRLVRWRSVDRVPPAGSGRARVP